MHFTLGSWEGGVSGDEGRSRRSTREGQRLWVRPVRGWGGLTAWLNGMLHLTGRVAKEGS